jgi:hypothetical protein
MSLSGCGCVRCARAVSGFQKFPGLHFGKVKRPARAARAAGRAAVCGAFSCHLVGEVFAYDNTVCS